MISGNATLSNDRAVVEQLVVLEDHADLPPVGGNLAALHAAVFWPSTMTWPLVGRSISAIKRSKRALAGARSGR